jgi:hypothetical protein
MQSTDLIVTISYNIYHASHKQYVTIGSASVEMAANPHGPIPTEYDAPVQFGPVYNNRITYRVLAADMRGARKILRAQERRLGLPNGALRTTEPVLSF